MRSSPGAKRMTKALARIAEINERRAHLDVVNAQRTLEGQVALREELSSAQSDEEAVALGDAAVSAGVIQLIGASRLNHARRLDALDQAMNEVQVQLSMQQDTHRTAIHKQRSAQKVAEHVALARAKELLQREQKVIDDLSCARFGRQVQASG